MRLLSELHNTDGHVRAAKVKVLTNPGTTILTRSLQHFIPLQVRTSEAGAELGSSECSSKLLDLEQPDSGCMSRRPQ